MRKAFSRDTREIEVEGGGGGARGAGAPPELSNFFSTNMVHISHMPPDTKDIRL